MPGDEHAAIDRGVMRVVRAVTRDLAGQGARAVVLHGSHATGQAHRHSDIDMHAIGTGRASEIERRSGYAVRSGHLVSLHWSTPAQSRALLRSPGDIGDMVPGWREAIILYDPDGIAARLKRAAERFTWDSVAAECDAWVAQQVTGYAEEMHKLVAALEAGNHRNAAVQRGVLAIRMAGIMAVRHRLLYGTDNVMFHAVGERMGAAWQRAQSDALSERAISLHPSCRAALRLYAMTAREAWPLLDRRQRAVVKLALEASTTGSSHSRS